MLRDRLILATSTISLVALQLALWPLILKSANLPSEVALWYTQADPAHLAPQSFLWIIPGAALVCWLINLALGHLLFRRYPLITQILACYSALICCLAAVAIIKTVLLYTTLL